MNRSSGKWTTAEDPASQRRVAARTTVADNIAAERADWLLDAVACATQDRRFLRGDPAYDETAGEAILANGKKAITVAIEKVMAEVAAHR